MKPHTDEPLNNGARARSRRGVLSRKGARRCGVVAAALSLVMLLSSCMSQGDVTETRADQLSLGDAVIAVRLSEGEFSAGLRPRRKTTGSCCWTRRGGGKQPVLKTNMAAM